MTRKTSASIFTGGGLFDIGARQAGYEILWGIEWDNKIASVARQNGLPVLTMDATKTDWSKLQLPDHLHASPPCPSFSIAKQNRTETDFDIEMAQAVCAALRELEPETFTLENVSGYKKSRSFGMITDCLQEMGYFWDSNVLNAADFGVPQTRRRLFVRASRNLLRPYPAAEKWVGWYEAIEDLIPSLPDSQFAPWQIARLPEEYITFLMQVQGEHGDGIRKIDEPCQTVAAGHSAGKYRAFVVSGTEQRVATATDKDQPMFTLKAQDHYPRAFILPGCGNTNIKDARPGRGVRYEEEPSHTIASDGGNRIPKAFICAGGSAGRNMPISDQEQPVFTVKGNAGAREPVRAYVGRVVKLTVQALGRFQTVPDDYVGLTTKINGNGVPCLLAKKVMLTLENKPS